MRMHVKASLFSAAHGKTAIKHSLNFILHTLKLQNDHLHLATNARLVTWPHDLEPYMQSHHMQHSAEELGFIHMTRDRQIVSVQPHNKVRLTCKEAEVLGAH